MYRKIKIKIAGSREQAKCRRLQRHYQRTLHVEHKIVKPELQIASFRYQRCVQTYILTYRMIEGDRISYLIIIWVFLTLYFARSSFPVFFAQKSVLHAFCQSLECIQSMFHKCSNSILHVFIQCVTCIQFLCPIRLVNLILLCFYVLSLIWSFFVLLTVCLQHVERVIDTFKSIKDLNQTINLFTYRMCLFSFQQFHTLIWCNKMNMHGSSHFNLGLMN